MQGQVSHGRPHYRCKLPEEYALKPDDHHPRNVYLREDQVIHRLDQWLATVFDADHLAVTARLMAATDEPDPSAAARQGRLRKVISDCDKSVGQYRKLLEAGGDPVDVAGWLAEAKAKRAQAERELADLASHRPIGAAEIEALLAQVPDKVAMLTGADVTTRQRLYSELGLTLTYHPERQVVTVEAQSPWGFDRVEGGEFNHNPTPPRRTLVGVERWDDYTMPSAQRPGG